MSSWEPRLTFRLLRLAVAICSVLSLVLFVVAVNKQDFISSTLFLIILVISFKAQYLLEEK